VPRAQPPRPPDHAQRELIASELGRNMLVEAAAGTGKTTSMVGRMVALLAGGRCRTETLAAVTFTRKAAAELRGRFQLALEEAAREAGGADAERLAAALERIDGCFIGTIHSFCARLLRERPVEAGLGVSFEELDEVGDARLRDEAWEEHLARLHAGESGGPLDELGRLGLAPAELREAFLSFADYPDVKEWPGADGGGALPDLAAAVEGMREYLEHIRVLVPGLPEETETDELMDHYRYLLRLGAYTDFEDPVQVVILAEQFARSAKVVQKHWPDKNTGKAEGKRWKEFGTAIAEPLLVAWRECRYGPAMRVLIGAREVYDRLRRERGVLNYGDLLLGAARLLRGAAHVRRYFAARYTHLLVDEFQDTDPVQAEVMLLLTSSDEKTADWRKCRPRPGSLFVVGDPKQSIYRFRRADIATYNQVRRIITEGDGLLVELSTNFRSTPDVVEWINAAFASEFPPRATEQSPAHVALRPGWTGEASGELSGVEVLRVPEEHSGNKAEVLAYDSELIARSIADAVARGASVPRRARDLERGAARNASPSDFMILARNTANLNAYGARLGELGIPYVITGGSALNELRELRMLWLCMAAVTRPDDPVALVAALRSELFGVSDRQLYAFRKLGGEFCFAAAPPAGLDREAAAAFGEAFSLLRRCAGWLHRLPAVAAVERIVADLGLLVLAGAGSGGDLRAGGLAKVVEVLRRARREAWSAEQLVELLGQLVEVEEKYDSISAVSVDRPAVRVMNLHKAKGLESPVVFLADPSGESRHDVEIHVDRSGGTVRGYLAVFGERTGSWGRRARLAQPPEWEALSERERSFCDAEALRLRYVAATRAGARLVITQRTKRNGTNPWKHFEPHLAGAGELSAPPAAAKSADAGTALRASEVRAAEKAIVERLARSRAATYDVRRAKEHALAGAGVDPHRPERRAENEAAAGGEHGAEWGAAVHALLEAAAADPGADLERLARAVLPEHGLPPELAGEAAGVVRSVMGSEIWARAVGSERRFVEVPFEVLLEDLGGERPPVPTLLRGAVDLAFREADGWVIVDYKTDDPGREGVEALAARYAPQVRLYARAWERCSGEAVKEAGLFLTRPGEYVAVDPAV
jgi:ATP-dependent helicase/nuclease subunit A